MENNQNKKLQKFQIKIKELQNKNSNPKNEMEKMFFNIMNKHFQEYEKIIVKGVKNGRIRIK